MTNFNNGIEEFDWNGTLVEDGNSFAILPAGEYDFEVTKVEKVFAQSGNKMAKVTLKIIGRDATGSVIDNMVLLKSMEWKLSSFFGSLGMKKKGEPLVMNWDAILGKTGRCKLVVEKYTKRDGSESERNGIDAYIYAEDVVKKVEQQSFAEEKQGYSSDFNFKGSFGN